MNPNYTEFSVVMEMSEKPNTDQGRIVKINFNSKFFPLASCLHSISHLHFHNSVLEVCILKHKSNS